MNLSRVILLVPALALVGACGLGTNSDSGSAERSAADAPGSTAVDTGSAAGSSTAPDASYDETGDLKAADALATGGTREAPAAETASVIHQGQISLHTSDVDNTRFELGKLLDGWDGEVASEQSDADKEGNTNRQSLELRVPSKHFDAAMTEISELGTLVDRNRTSEDVTTQVIDNEVRVRTQKASILRIQALLAQAQTINQVIAIEQQLSQRQAELDSLEQQQKYLADQTEMSTINVYLSVPPDGASDSDNAFVAGLKAGWEKLGEATTVVLTALGAVLPFAVVIALVATPLWLARRRRIRPVDTGA